MVMLRPGSAVTSSWSLLWTALLSLILLWSCGLSQASMYHSRGKCTYKDKLFKAGASFQRGCDKCFCHEFGFFCFSPNKPTSWPNKCQRLMTECGYRVVYKHSPELECRAYSWIG